MLLATVLTLGALMLPVRSNAQSPYEQQAPYPYPGPAGTQYPAQPPSGGQMPYGPPPGVPPQQQRPLEYAFRPDLTNPQFGECLVLEKNWRTLWETYYLRYQQAQALSPQDPRLAQMSYYLADLKRRLDYAWQLFSSKCIYYPSH